MNFAALLGVLAAVTFTLPLVAKLAESLGLHRNTGVAVSLLLACVAAGAWYVKSVRARGAAPTRRRAPSGRVEQGPAEGVEKEHDASTEGHR
ncbi:MAG: hypothetical protein WDA03_04110 [Trueperaceae bacterium]|jgi:hypothetical protein